MQCFPAVTSAAVWKQLPRNHSRSRTKVSGNGVFTRFSMDLACTWKLQCLSRPDHLRMVFALRLLFLYFLVFGQKTNVSVIGCFNTAYPMCPEERNQEVNGSILFCAFRLELQQSPVAPQNAEHSESAWLVRSPGEPQWSWLQPQAHPARPDEARRAPAPQRWTRSLELCTHGFMWFVT